MLCVYVCMSVFAGQLLILKLFHTHVHLYNLHNLSVYPNFLMYNFCFYVLSQQMLGKAHFPKEFKVSQLFLV